MGLKMKSYIKNLSIRNKISYSFILFFTILVLSVIFIIRGVYHNQMHEQLIQRRDYEDQLISQQMKRIADGVNSCSNSVIVNLNIVLEKNIAEQEFPNLYDPTTNRKILSVIDNSLLMFPDIYQVGILYQNGDYYYKIRNGSYFASNNGQTILRELSQLEIDTTGKWWYPVGMESYGLESPLRYVKLLRDSSNNTDMGYVILELDEQKLYRLYHNADSFEPVDFFLLDHSGRIVSSNLRQMVGGTLPVAVNETVSRAQNKTGDNSDDYAKRTDVDGNWLLLSVTDVQSSLSDINLVTQRIILACVVVLILFYFFILFIASRIAKPIGQLSSHMVNFQSSLPEKLPELDSNDEIGILITNFNIMIQKNQDLFSKVQEEQKIKRRLELALLQAQIKPHFLYNTLDTIYCLNSIGRGEEASRVTKLLADYYRLVLNRGEEWIWLATELEALNKYLEIQQVRYHDIISYQIRIPSGMNWIQIPKLTLQPLIENAIYHGIKPKHQRGTIEITGVMENGWVMIKIIDDGVGMTRQAFDKILAGVSTGTDGESFGLKNVSERLKLFYGSRSHLSLEQDEQGRTVISVCIYWGSEE